MPFMLVRLHRLQCVGLHCVCHDLILDGTIDQECDRCRASNCYLTEYHKHRIYVARRKVEEAARAEVAGA
jgi:hypothetical protein